MTVTLQLKPDLEAARTFAEAEGVAVEDYLNDVLEENMRPGVTLRSVGATSSATRPRVRCWTSS